MLNKISDEEYIVRIKNRDNRRKFSTVSYAVIFLVSLTVMSVLFYISYQTIIEIIKETAKGDIEEEMNTFHMGFWLGIGAAALTITVIEIPKKLLDLSFSKRSERLLLKYYELAKK